MSWHPHSIGEITHVVTKGTTPTTLGRQFTDSGVNFIKAEALNGDSGLDNGGFFYIDEDTHELLGRSMLQRGRRAYNYCGSTNWQVRICKG